MSIINGTVKFLLRDRFSDIEYFRNNPLDAQQQIFQYLVWTSQWTEWGKKYKFKSIQSIRDFQQRVPVTDYETLYPYIKRMLEGESNILWPSPIKWFAKSSGTTSDKSKFIPISKENLEDCHFKASKDLMANYSSLFPNTKLFTGKCLVVGGSHQIHQNNKEINYGDLSAVLLQNMSLITNYFRTPSRNVALMDDWEKKMELMARETINENVTYLAGVPSWTLVLINKLLDLTGKDNLMDIWPNLQLYIHGGVSFNPYKDQFNALIVNDNMRYFQTYNASEGFFAFQDVAGADDMLLLTNNGIFYEFIPTTEYASANPRTLTLDEIELDKNYALVISTNSGLWRYMIGDTIRFTSINPYRIKVSGRIKHYINAFGEEVIIENAEKAIEQACKLTDATISDYTAAPVYLKGSQSGYHEWIIEFDKEPEDISLFTSELDKALQNINSDYEAKRYNNFVMKGPLIHKAKKGLFHNWLKNKGKLGGQHKVPRLSNDRKYIEEILAIMK